MSRCVATKWGTGFMKGPSLIVPPNLIWPRPPWYDPAHPDTVPSTLIWPRRLWYLVNSPHVPVPRYKMRSWVFPRSFTHCPVSSLSLNLHFGCSAPELNTPPGELTRGHVVILYNNRHTPISGLSPRGTSQHIPLRPVAVIPADGGGSIRVRTFGK